MNLNLKSKSRANSIIKNGCVLITFLLWPFFLEASVTDSDTISKVDEISAKAEAFFKKFPVPMYSYSTEAGHIFGLAKYNLFKLSKDDLVSQACRISEVVSFSTEGRVNISVATDLIWNENKYIVLGYINYKKQPEYILGIGNDVSIDDVEEIFFDRFKFSNIFLMKFAENLYAGITAEISDYTNIGLDSNSFIINENIAGREPGTNTSFGLNLMYDSRDNRYNAFKGYYARLYSQHFPSFLGNDNQFSKYELDLRYYNNPWLKHVIAFQTTTSMATGDVPFYELSMLGGESKMRGYYLGALRDKVLVDGQFEYRMPVWKMLGLTTWIGTGRVAETYKGLTIDGFWLSYGLGLRLKVDSNNNTNLRFDWGYGPGGISGFYISFAEAF